MKQKFYVAKRTTNRIAYRALNSFERRNPVVFELCHSAHETWEEAVQALARHGLSRQRKAETELKSARRAMDKIRAMEKP